MHEEHGPVLLKGGTREIVQARVGLWSQAHPFTVRLRSLEDPHQENPRSYLASEAEASN